MSAIDWHRIYKQALNSLSLPDELAPDQIHRLVQRGMLVDLLEDGSTAAIQIIKRAVVSAPLTQIQQDALNGLITLARKNHSQAITSLYELALEHQHSGAITAITKYRFEQQDAALMAAFAFLFLTFDEYTKFDPDYSRLAQYLFHSPLSSSRLATTSVADSPEKARFVGVINALVELQPQSASWLLAEFSRFTPPEKDWIFHRLVELADQSGSVLARDLLCRLAILHDHAGARQLCAERNYLPTDTPSQAAFLFLTEQWDAHQQMDYSGQWLTAAYEAGDANLKQKILSQSRSSGKTEWLNNIPHTRTAINLNALTPRDWKIILEGLFVNQAQDTLMRLLQYAPAYWVVQILHRLSENPTAVEANEPLSALIEAARPCFGKPPEVTPAGYLQFPGNGISALAVSPNGRELAVGSSDSALRFWNFDLQRWQPELISPVANCRVLCYSPDGEFLISASGDHRIRIYRSSNHNLLKTLSEHRAQIKSLIFQPDGHMLYSTGLDGVICAWRFPSGTLAYPPIETGVELFGLALTGKNNLLVSGGANQICQVRDPLTGILVDSLSLFEDTILALAANTQQWVAVSTRDRNLHLINPLSGTAIMPAIPVPNVINQLLFHPAGNWLFSFDLGGQVRVWHAATLEMVVELTRHTQPGSGLALAADGQTLISASNDGKIILWDLRTANWVFQAAWQDAPSEIAALEDLLSFSKFSQSNQNWLKFLLSLNRWRARFDILISEPQVLVVGEYDILL